MKSKVFVDDNFQKPAKKLTKRYPSFPQDLLKLIEELELNPFLGTPLGGDLRKVRLAIKSKAKGKSGGARVITFVYLAHRSVHLLTVYDKSEIDSITDADLRPLAEEIKQRLEETK